MNLKEIKAAIKMAAKHCPDNLIDYAINCIDEQARLEGAVYTNKIEYSAFMRGVNVTVAALKAARQIKTPALAGATINIGGNQKCSRGKDNIAKPIVDVKKKREK